MPLCPYPFPMLVSGRELLESAVLERRAVGSFNTYSLEITRAILRAAEARNAPVFLAIGTGAFDYAGFDVLATASLAAARESSVPVAVHVDHAPDVVTVALRRSGPYVRDDRWLEAGSGREHRADAARC